MKLVKKEILKKKYERWDLTVEKFHNYLVEGVVVHNSNCRVGIAITEGSGVDDSVLFEFKAGSHRVKRKAPPEDQMQSNTYWFPHTITGVKELLTDLIEEGRAKMTATLYGEVYGRVRGGHKSMHYGKPNSLNYSAFALKIDGKYSNWNEFSELCQKYEIPVVPLLDIIPFNMEKIKELSKGESVLAKENGTNHIREGVGVLPVKERENCDVGRVILKVINPDYLLMNPLLLIHQCPIL